MRKQNFSTPEEWRELKKKDKFNMLTRLFFIKCSESSMFKNGRISPDYTKIRAHFMKQQISTIHVIYDYLYSLERQVMSLTDIYKHAEKYRQEQIIARDKEKNSIVENYQDYLDIIKDGDF